jgi:hypothetical protein
MDCLGLAGVCIERDGNAPSRGGGADLRPVAGEDDIDAPDLNAPSTAASGVTRPGPATNSGSNGAQSQASPPELGDRATRERGTRITGSHHFSPMLDPEDSAALRDQLAAELKGIGSLGDATNWAQRVLAAKGTLQPGDARQIEEVFRERILAFERAGDAAKPQRSRGKAKSSIMAAATRERQAQPNCGESFDKSSLAHPEPRRIRDRDHLRFVTQQDCLICGRKPSDAHHLRFYPASGAGSQGQRRICSTTLPGPSSRDPSLG